MVLRGARLLLTVIQADGLLNKYMLTAPDVILMQEHLRIQLPSTDPCPLGTLMYTVFSVMSGIPGTGQLIATGCR